MRVKLKDIARMANVSETTVSLVLNHAKSRISEAKKQEIFEIAEKYNYKANYLARGLSKQTTNTIGLIMPDITNPFFSSLARDVSNQLTHYDYMSFIVNTDDIYESQKKMILELQNRSVDGLMIVLALESFETIQPTIADLEMLDIPYVLIDRSIPDFRCNKVVFDNEYGGYIATKALIEAGHRHIGCIGLNADSQNISGIQRYQGYLKALDESNIGVNNDYVAPGDFHFEGGYKAADVLLRHKELTAVFAINDLTAFGFMRRSEELGIHCPQDISIVGYDNLDLAQMMGLPLTSVRQSTALLAQESVRNLMKQLEEKDFLQEITLEPQLIYKSTVERIKLA